MGIFGFKKKKKGETEFVKDPAAFIKFLRENDEEMAGFGRATLVAAGAEAIDPLIELLTDENEDVKTRTRAGIALGDIGNPSITPLLEVLKEQKFKTRFSAEVIGMAAEALSAIGNQAIEPLVQALKSELRPVRFGAATALVKTGDAKAMDAVRNAANHCDPGDREMFNIVLKR